MGRARTVVDAISANLEASLVLPDHQVQKYAPPLSMTPERCPMLAVYIIRYPRRIIATPGTYEWDLDIEIAWLESAAAYAETAGATDNYLPARLLDTIELIGDHLETYAVAIPGVPVVVTNLPAYATIGAGETRTNVSGLCWEGVYELSVTGTALRSIP